ncbi:MAG: hydrogenase maturation nickel metallochaperone HypA [Ktedonobacteraceae bacterium]|nr:hydrogenase maturation nickel metallochaperone HypA [Ktedonobacteraceae bacterium]
MHELAIAQSIVEAVEARALECNATRVKDVHLKIGEASGIVSDSLTFCFEMLTNELPILVGAQLSIDTLPHRARCHHCDKEFVIENYVAQCPTCHEWSNDIISGTELQIMHMEIETS